MRPNHRDPRPLAQMPVPGDPMASDGERLARSVTVNLAESPLGWLHARGHLTQRQFDAGDKLRFDFENAQLAPGITMRWSFAPVAKGRRSGPGVLNSTERQMVAKQRFDAAIDALGKDLSHIAWRVICAGEGVPAAEKQLGWPARSGKLVLRIALDRLADYYRLQG